MITIKELENPVYPEYPWFDPDNEIIVSHYEFTFKAIDSLIDLRIQARERAEMMVPPDYLNKLAYYELIPTPDVNGCVGWIYAPLATVTSTETEVTP